LAGDECAFIAEMLTSSGPKPPVQLDRGPAERSERAFRTDEEPAKIRSDRRFPAARRGQPGGNLGAYNSEIIRACTESRLRGGGTPQLLSSSRRSCRLPFLGLRIGRRDHHLIEKFNTSERDSILNKVASSSR
jgi:hypothetical protein